MRGSRMRGYNVSTFEGRGHGSSEAGQNRQLERGPSRQADA
jgi:alpha-beta hydrolase superfamily lysophospholipase